MKGKKIVALCLAGAVFASILGGCGLNTEATVATMQGETVSLGVANFMCRYQQVVSDESFRSYFGEDVWQQDLYGNGSTFQESVKSDVMESIHAMYTLKGHMDEYGVTISEDEKKAISEAAAAFIEGNSAEVLKELNATQEIVEEMLTLYTIQQKMQDAIYAQADTEVSDEEANMRAYTLVSVSTSSYYDSDSGNYVDYTDEELAQLEQEANSIYDAIEEPKELESAAEELGYEATTGTYDADDTALDTSVKEALDKLKKGEMTSLITTDSGYYIARLDSEHDEEATETNRENIIAERQDTLYTETLSGWQEDDGWTVDEKMLAKIQFTNAFTQTLDTEEVEGTESAE